MGSPGAPSRASLAASLHFPAIRPSLSDRSKMACSSSRSQPGNAALCFVDLFSISSPRPVPPAQCQGAFGFHPDHRPTKQTPLHVRAIHGGPVHLPSNHRRLLRTPTLCRADAIGTMMVPSSAKLIISKNFPPVSCSHGLTFRRFLSSIFACICPPISPSIPTSRINHDSRVGKYRARGREPRVYRT